MVQYIIYDYCECPVYYFAGIFFQQTIADVFIYMHGIKQYIWCDGSYMYIPQSNDIDSSCISVGIMNEICYCYAFIKSICLLMDPLQYLGVYLTFQLVSLCVFIVEYSFMSTLKWHLFMTSLKPV